MKTEDGGKEKEHASLPLNSHRRASRASNHSLHPSAHTQSPRYEWRTTTGWWHYPGQRAKDNEAEVLNALI